MLRSRQEKCCSGVLWIIFFTLFLAVPAFSQQVSLKSLKAAYASGEKISVTVTNSLPVSIFSVAAGAQPEMALTNIEKKASVGWDAYPLRCRQPSCTVDYVMPEPEEIKPGASVSFSWEPKIFVNNTYVSPDPGIYRLTILYQVRKPGKTLTWNWTTVRSDTFTLE